MQKQPLFLFIKLQVSGHFEEHLQTNASKYIVAQFEKVTQTKFKILIFV